MQAHIKNDGQKESVNKSEIIMGGVNPIVVCHRARVGSGGYINLNNTGEYVCRAEAIFSVNIDFKVTACYQKSSKYLSPFLNNGYGDLNVFL